MQRKGQANKERHSNSDAIPVQLHDDHMNANRTRTAFRVAILVIVCRPKYNEEVQRLQGFRFQCQPTNDQASKMGSFAGSCRFVYNRALAMQRARYAQGQKKLSYAALCRELTAWRRDPTTAWLASAPIHPLQQALKNLERAYSNFFEDLRKLKRGEIQPEGVREPRFRKRGHGDKFRYPDPQQFSLDGANARLFLPKLGWVRFRKSREILGEPRSATVSCSAGRWFVSILTAREIDEPLHPAQTIVGLDLGVVRFATLSDGTVFEPRANLKRYKQRLARFQRALTRKAKFSKNWKKAKARLSRLHARIANGRRDYLDKISTTISKNHAVVCIEDLRIKNMTASAHGTRETPGRNVRQKTGLNRSILDQGWRMFRSMLEYKQRWRGGYVVAVPAQDTSRTCIVCLHVSTENRKAQMKFECVECGYQQDADVVGAINILRAGHARLACGETSPVGASAQEPITRKLRAVA